jgi:hypothetical protein
MRIFPAFTTVSVLSILAVAGCGGESIQSDDDAQAGDSGSGGSAQSGTGGSSSTGKAGSGGTAGTGRAGSGQAGTTAGAGNVGGSGVVTGGAGGRAGGGSGGQSAGSAGSAGAGEAGAGGEGGAPQDICQLPAEPGTCEAAIERWFFDATRGVCTAFTYGGCEGNENNFETLEQCHASCSGHGTTAPTACTNATQCVVTRAQCCGQNPDPTIRDVTAVNAASLADFNAPCALVDCVSSGPVPSHFGATCNNGHCLAFDVRGTELTACTAPSDCRLRAGLACCEACDAEHQDFVALRVDVDLSSLACGDAPINCGACQPMPPAGLVADCLEGHCRPSQLDGAAD